MGRKGPQKKIAPFHKKKGCFPGFQKQASNSANKPRVSKNRPMVSGKKKSIFEFDITSD